MATALASPCSRAPHRPLSLPPLHPISPIVLPFDTILSSTLRPPNGNNPASPISAAPSPTSDGHAPFVLSRAVKAYRTTADLIRILDLEVGLEEMGPADSREKSSMSSPNTIPVDVEGTAADHCLDAALVSPKQSPLTRANMFKLRDVTRTSKRPLSPPITSITGSSVLRGRLASPIHFALPPRPPSKRSTTVTESSYGPIRSVPDEDLHLGSDPANVEMGWPGRARVDLPDTMSQLSLYPTQPPLASQRQLGSFMHLDGRNGSDTFEFPASPATEAESDYAPSIAAPSSVRRRVAKWTSMQEAVPEEDELESNVSAAAYKPHPPPLVSSLRPAHAPMEEPEITPTKSHCTTCSDNRASEASGHTFGRSVARRAIPADIDPMVTETFADLDRIRTEMLRYDTDKSAPALLAKAGSPASDISFEPRGIESDEAITAHLMKAAATNDHRILPVDPETRIGPSGRGGFPTTFDTARSTHGAPHSPTWPRLLNKVDQLLGRGAYEAGMSMEQERRLLREALANSIVGPGAPSSLPPPPRQPKTPATIPLHSSSVTMEPASSPRRLDHAKSSQLLRGGSSESISASLAESITCLIPPPLPSKPEDMRTALKAEPVLALPDVTSKNELTAEQKQVLLRRVRVLEKRLGEPLREDETGKWVVQPSTGIESAGDMYGVGHARAQSSLQRIKAVFGLDTVEHLEARKAEPSGGAALDVALVRTLSVDSRDSLPGDEYPSAQRRRQIAKLNKMLGTIVHPSHLNQGYLPTSASALRLPAASASDNYTPSDEISFIEMDSPKTSSLRLSDSTGAKETWATKVRQTMGRRSASSKEIEVIGQDLSFFDMRKDGRGWRKHRPYASSPAAGCLGSGERGFCDKPPELSASEKMQATRKAKKLSQKFGEAPPQDLYHPSAIRPFAHDPVSNLTGGSSSMVSISQSLQGLMYLTENDPSRLYQIVDVLAEDSPFSSPPASPDLTASVPVSPPRPYRASTSSSFEVYFKSSLPTTPPRPLHPVSDPLFSPSVDDISSPEENPLSFDPSSHDARRRRSGKLSQFFGEVIDFERPPPVPPKKKTKKEVLDGVLGEMWRAVQIENRRGVLGREEMDKVGAMIAAVRKSQQ